MISADSSIVSTSNSAAVAATDSTRRRSTFYVPLTSDADEPTNEVGSSFGDQPAVSSIASKPEPVYAGEPAMYNPDLSACSFDWSLDESLNNSSLLVTNDALIGTRRSPKSRRYGVVLNSINLDEDETLPSLMGAADSADAKNHTVVSARSSASDNTSTPKKKTLSKAHSRASIVDANSAPNTLPHHTTTPLKEKSATLPQNLSASNTFPPKNSFLMKSSPRISFKYFSDSSSSHAQPAATAATVATPSPKKSLSFIRRAHSTKLSRSNSLLKSLTSKCVDQGVDNMCRSVVSELQLERLEAIFRAENGADQIRELFLREFVDPVPAVSSPDGGVYRVKSESNGCGGRSAKQQQAGQQEAEDSDIHSGNCENRSIYRLKPIVHQNR